jgi:hypothetical protein
LHPYLRKKLLAVEGSTTRRQTLIDFRRQRCGLVKLESAAAVVGSSKYIKQGINSLTRLVQEYDARKTKYSLQKEDNLINIYEETGAQNIKNQLQSST